MLDEIPEYPCATLESLRQPLEDKTVTISRAGGHMLYPADFMLVATMNPYSCGFYGDESRKCRCSSTQILAYQKRLSEPLLDRIDMIVSVSRVPNNALLDHVSMSKRQQPSAVNIINMAKELQLTRYNSGIKNNSNLTNHGVKKHLALSHAVCQLLTAAAGRLNLSARSYFKVIKVARTIADLDDPPHIAPHHVSEALQYRQNT